MRDYLTKLCESIAASMISDPDLRLTVTADDSLLAADTSVSLGLIVTELAINALKHAYPGGRSGEICVSFAAQGDDWRLAVRDDGVGMVTAKQPSPVSGLGSTIVRALARQLNARVMMTDAGPGTVVSIEHNASDDAAANAERRAVPAV
jgi:two-component sensor histidine kinase